MIPLFSDIQDIVYVPTTQKFSDYKNMEVYTRMDANDHWKDVQTKYNNLINSGNSHDDAVRTLQIEFKSIGPRNQERLRNGHSNSEHPDVEGPPSSGNQTEAGLRPTLVNIDGKNHAYQTVKNPKGLFVFLHGCSRSVFGAWPKSSNLKFYGLPEDVSRTKQVLKAGYAILYVSPSDQKTGCFSMSADGKSVLNVIKQVRSNLGLDGKPLYLAGCSAGGGLIQRLAASGQIQGSGMIDESATTADPTNKTPPSVWIALSTPKEQATAKERVNTLKKFGKSAGMLISDKRKVYDAYFSDQIASISPSNSKKITDTLKKTGIVDASGNVVKDPKGDKAWYNQLGKIVPIPETQIGFWNSSVVQAMMVAYAIHDAISIYTMACLKWFEGGFKEDLSSLAKKYVVTRPAYFSAI